MGNRTKGVGTRTVVELSLREAITFCRETASSRMSQAINTSVLILLPPTDLSCFPLSISTRGQETLDINHIGQLPGVQEG